MIRERPRGPLRSPARARNRAVVLGAKLQTPNELSRLTVASKPSRPCHMSRAHSLFGPSPMFSALRRPACKCSLSQHWPQQVSPTCRGHFRAIILSETSCSCWSCQFQPVRRKQSPGRAMRRPVHCGVLGTLRPLTLVPHGGTARRPRWAHSSETQWQTELGHQSPATQTSLTPQGPPRWLSYRSVTAHRPTKSPPGPVDLF